jgi:hypothetical protein
MMKKYFSFGEGIQKEKRYVYTIRKYCVSNILKSFIIKSSIA